MKNKDDRMMYHMLFTAFMAIMTALVASCFVNKNLACDLGAVVIFASTVYYLMFLADDDRK